MSPLHILKSADGTPILHAPTDAVFDELTARYNAANSIGYKLISTLGGGAEQLFSAVPTALRKPVETLTLSALESSFEVADRRQIFGRAERLIADNPRRHTALATALGVVGGMGGVGTAMAEVPLSTVLMMRQIQSVARVYGFDPSRTETRKDCLQLFAGTGPLDGDGDVDLGFVSARVTLTGVTLNAMLIKLAPRVAAMMGQRLATRAVPVLGAAAGAATNYSFIRYHENMAHLYFGMQRLSEDSATPLPQIVDTVRTRVRRSSPVR